MTIQPKKPLTPCACTRPAIETMDYMKYAPDQWNRPRPRINRCCTKCWAHWFGPPAAVKYFTQAQWHAAMQEAAP